MAGLKSVLISVLRAAFLTRTHLALENAALRQQLTIYRRIQKHARLRSGDRVYWVLLRRPWSGWERTLIVVKPQTVVAWHREGFRVFWRHRSRGHGGRPRFPREHRAFIQRISGAHPRWGEDRIALELVAKFRLQPWLLRSALQDNELVSARQVLQHQKTLTGPRYGSWSGRDGRASDRARALTYATPSAPT
jgi:hypothetical protein